MDGFPFLNFFGEADNPSYLDPNLGLPTLHQEDTHQDTVVYPFEDEEEKKRKEEKRKELMAQIAKKEHLLSLNRAIQMHLQQQIDLVTSFLTQESESESEELTSDYLLSFPSTSPSCFFSRKRKNYPRFVSSEGKVLSLASIKPLSIKRWTPKSDQKLTSFVSSQCTELIKNLSVPDELLPQCYRYNASNNKAEKDQILHEMIPVLIGTFSWESISIAVGHTCNDCFVHWLNCCDPLINTDPWSLEEDSQLDSIVKEKGGRDWREIASELNTSRTPYQCFERFVRVLEIENYNQKWTAEEDSAVLEGVKQYGTKNWKKVAQLVKTKQWMQCRSRYFQSLRFQGKKGRWSALENNRLLLLLLFYGLDDWTRIANHMVSRNVMQCRDRWKNILHPDVVSTPWTSKENALLRKLTRDKSRIVWKEICKSFPGRTADACKSHYKNRIATSSTFWIVCFILKCTA